jgi:hypothetical protein
MKNSSAHACQNDSLTQSTLLSLKTLGVKIGAKRRGEGCLKCLGDVLDEGWWAMNEWCSVRRGRELFILIGKSNHSDLSRKFQHRSSELLALCKNNVHVDSPLGLLAYRRNSRWSLGLPVDRTFSFHWDSRQIWRARWLSPKVLGLPTPETPDFCRDFRRMKVCRRAMAKSVSTGTSGTKHWDFQ